MPPITRSPVYYTIGPPSEVKKLPIVLANNKNVTIVYVRCLLALMKVCK